MFCGERPFIAGLAAVHYNAGNDHGENTDMGMQIRPALEQDVEQLAALNGEVQALHAELFPHIFCAPQFYSTCDWFRRCLLDESLSVLVAEDAGQLTGYLVLQRKISPAHEFTQERQCGYITQVCVGEQFRGRGIFKELLSAAKRLARDWGYQRLELDVWSNNSAAKNAFLRCGFTTYNEKMSSEV